jgi:dTDP-4-dehydrorhamnose reductase
MDRVVVLGSNGQVGRAWIQLLGHAKAIAATREEADLSHPEKYLAYLDAQMPSAVINAGAYTQVDLAEKEEVLAHKINAEAPGKIAQWCASKNIPFVHFSTDYVFPGTGHQPWKETHTPHPLSVYGKTKAQGEENVRASGARHLIFRTSWVYDGQGKNFLNTMLKLGRDRESLKIVSDQVGAPTYAPDLARASWEALQSALKMPQFPFGIYHLCNGGETTWFGFAQKIFEIARRQGISLRIKDVVPISSSDYPTPAERPKNSRLCTEKMQNVFGIQLPEWQKSLELCMKSFPGAVL